MTLAVLKLNPNPKSLLYTVDYNEQHLEELLPAAPWGNLLENPFILVSL